MKKMLLIKIIFPLAILSLFNIDFTNAYFTDRESIGGVITAAGCWTGPSIPQLSYPEDGYIAYPYTNWRLDPYMDWNDSWACPGKILTYQYESYKDEDLTILAYRSGWLNISEIPAPNTPIGTYYWRVRAYDGEQMSDWSEAWQLIVTNYPPVNTYSLPIDIVESE